jgi:hypothetical protein
LYAFVFSPTRATRTPNLILLDLIIHIIFGEDYRLWSCLLGNVPSPATSSILHSNIFLRTLFSNTFSLFIPLMRRTKFHTHTKQQARIT